MSAPSDPHGVTGRLATWIHDLSWDDVPTHVRDRAAHLLLDGLGCALVGAQLPWSRIATEAVLGIEGRGGAVVIGTGRTTTPAGAALLNSAYIQGFELDDFHPLAPLHSASLMIPSLLATRSHLGRDVSGRELLLAAIVGFEVGPRVGYAIGGTGMLLRGWHSGPVFGTAAAAAACAKLRGLDPAVIEDALGFAATQSAGLMSAQYEAMGKRMQHGFAARNGFYSAALAAAGYTGIDQVFEREYGGYVAVYGEGHPTDTEAIVRGLGESWETTMAMVKSWAVMGGLHGAVQASQALRARLAGRAIERIDIRVGDVVYRHGWWRPTRPLEAIGGQMNIGCSTAVTLLDGTALPEQFTAARLDAGDVWHLLDRTHVTLDRSIDALPLNERFQTHITLTFTDGTTDSESVISPHGNPSDPVTDDEVVAKFHALTERVMDAGRAAAIVEAVRGLPDAPSVASLVDLLAGPVGRALD
ncbi:MmgE/PrpD family protein [Streptomyces sp. NBC_00557]|uniref:MmgE/PrpD family protein n=1 Tax=Streptomyces sp. NBC_00557 TaxID=2975776 RepID=UPI002E8212D1|nr:MmgE/PrpD family protein [Streptomyces sp. NBC_00557]WUC39497.1 MmgE/PrpD family protein [Streptomyces sp. NBC_00557]